MGLKLLVGGYLLHSLRLILHFLQAAMTMAMAGVTTRPLSAYDLAGAKAWQNMRRRRLGMWMKAPLSQVVWEQQQPLWLFLWRLLGLTIHHHHLLSRLLSRRQPCLQLQSHHLRQHASHHYLLQSSLLTVSG
jgi:hypothetical protein